MKANGTWGSICTFGTLIGDFEATVICRQLNFKDGFEVVFPTYTPLNGSVQLTNVNCKGNETDIRDCLLSGFGEQVEDKCLSHKYDLAIRCYSDGKYIFLFYIFYCFQLTTSEYVQDMPYLQTIHTPMERRRENETEANRHTYI